MDSLESPDNTVLTLYPPQVQGASDPVEGAHIGLSLANYDLVNDGLGATVKVDPPLVGTLEPGDVMALCLEGETAFLDSQIVENPDAITTLRIPKGRLHPDRINEVFYTITRGSQNKGRSVPNLTLLFNKIRPGLKDRLPEIEGHSELELLLPDEIKNGVGADFVSAHVCLSYPYCRAYDTITLKCNGESMTYKVGQFEAPQPPDPGSAIPIKVCFTVTRAYLDKAKRADQQLVFSFTVTDQLGNTPDTDAVWSASQTVDEDLTGTRLAMPILLERMEDFPGDDSTLIELDKLAGGPLLVVVITADNRFQAGDIVEATYTAKVPGQPGDVVVPVIGVVEADPFGQKKPCILLVPNDKVIASSGVTVVFRLLRGVDVIGHSKPANAQVIGDSTITLAPPVPAANPVDPLAYDQGVMVQVAYPASLPGDQAQLNLLNPLPGSPAFPVLPLDPNHQATFTLDAAFLGAWHGKAPQLVWVLMRAGKERARSGPLEVTVSRIAEGDVRLPTPTIDGAVGNELDVSKMQVTDQLRIVAWRLQWPGQYVWLRYDGIDATGAAIFFEDREGEANETFPGLARQAPLNWLQGLKKRSSLSVSFKVNFDGVSSRATATGFPVREYLIKETVAEGYENFEGEPVGYLTKNIPYKLSSGLVLTCTADKCGVGVFTATIPGFDLKYLFIPNSSIKIEFPQPVSSISFHVASAHGQGNTATFWEQGGSQIEFIELPVTGNFNPTKISFESKDGAKIKYFVIAVQEPGNDQGIFFDNLTWH